MHTTISMIDFLIILQRFFKNNELNKVSMNDRYYTSCVIYFLNILPILFVIFCCWR
jgi:hypothetical protein